MHSIVGTLFLALFFVITGCATPYQSGGYRGGYSEEPIGNGVVAVSFRGNGYTRADTVMTYVKKRAFEYCQEQGMEDYEVVDAAGDHSQEVHTGAFDGLAKTTSFHTVTKHSATLYIRCT